jgi:hypothetical protein
MRSRRNSAVLWLALTTAGVGFAQTLPPPANEKPASVEKAGEKKDNFQMKLVPVGTISGRVLDADGQPVDAIPVQAEQGGRPQRAGVTDDRGGAEPGDDDAD